MLEKERETEVKMDQQLLEEEEEEVVASTTPQNAITAVTADRTPVHVSRKSWAINWNSFSLGGSN